MCGMVEKVQLAAILQAFSFASQPFDWFADSSVFMWHFTQKS